jgi:hypothetical protein
LLAALAVACALAPPPRIFSQVDAARSSPSVVQSKSLAPQVYLRAERLRGQAEQAHADGKVGAAQVLAEHALAAYEHAVVLSRLATAEARLAKSKLELEKVSAEHTKIDERQLRVAAEAESLELRVRVAQDAIPLVPNAPASPEREQARLAAARALASQAKLLCAATRLLGGSANLATAEKALETLEAEVSGTPKVAPIDGAVRARSECLKLLTSVRRSRSKQSAADADATDALLNALSNTKRLYPFRDDRGVVVTMRGVLAKGGTLSPDAAALLTTLGNVAKAHPSFPVMVVLHSGGAGGRGAEAGGKRVADALEAAGARQVEVHNAGARQPIADPKRADSRPQNERLEVVFVAPRW